ncbi:hypothetical protein NAPIS_ORF00127, partial [Vairimorpha apis BRL 01]
TQTTIYTIYIYKTTLRKTRALTEKTHLNREYFNKIEKLIHTGDNLYCKVCNNKIGTEWDEDEDAFVSYECVMIDEDEYCHKMCGDLYKMGKELYRGDLYEIDLFKMGRNYRKELYMGDLYRCMLCKMECYMECFVRRNIYGYVLCKIREIYIDVCYVRWNVMKEIYIDM